jgi:hypothetical protein
MKALIITWENFQDQELVYPYYRLKEETDDVVVMSNVVGKFFGIMGSNMTSHVNVEQLIILPILVVISLLTIWTTLTFLFCLVVLRLWKN